MIGIIAKIIIEVVKAVVPVAVDAMRDSIAPAARKAVRDSLRPPPVRQPAHAWRVPPSRAPAPHVAMGPKPARKPRDHHVWDSWTDDTQTKLREWPICINCDCEQTADNRFAACPGRPGVQA